MEFHYLCPACYKKHKWLNTRGRAELYNGRRPVNCLYCHRNWRWGPADVPNAYDPAFYVLCRMRPLPFIRRWPWIALQRIGLERPVHRLLYKRKRRRPPFSKTFDAFIKDARRFTLDKVLDLPLDEYPIDTSFPEQWRERKLARTCGAYAAMTKGERERWKRALEDGNIYTAWAAVCASCTPDKTCEKHGNKERHKRLEEL